MYLFIYFLSTIDVLICCFVGTTSTLIQHAFMAWRTALRLPVVDGMHANSVTIVSTAYLACFIDATQDATQLTRIDMLDFDWLLPMQCCTDTPGRPVNERVASLIRFL